MPKYTIIFLQSIFIIRINKTAMDKSPSWNILLKY